MKEFTISLLVLFTLFSCTPADERTDQGQQSNHPPVTNSPAPAEAARELTREQQSAFDALNTLQTSTDEKNHLYSTFPDILQPCYPPDTSFVISRAELLMAMEKFVVKHCTQLPVEERNELAATAVLAQEEYVVNYCPANADQMDYDSGLPMTGTWVMPGVLGRRDVILVW